MKSLKYLMLALALTLVSGCASLSNGQSDGLQLPVTYGTLKVIERDNGINAGDVIEVVSKVEAFVSAEASISGTAIRSYVVSLEQWQELSPADKYLVSTLFTSVEESIEARVSTGDLLEGGIKVRVEQLLSYVRTAALMSQ